MNPMGVTGYEVLPGVIRIPGVGVGTLTDRHKGTGVTVIVLPEGAVGGVDVAGGASATRETPVLDAQNTVVGLDAIVLCGGSAMGLQSADGVALGLFERQRGVQIGAVRIPIVVAAAIFDMDYGRAEPPTLVDGQSALNQAYEMLQIVPEGSFGAGTGATVGKSLGKSHAMKGGQGAVTLVAPDGLSVGVIVVVNAIGSILGAEGQLLAGPREDGGVPLDTTTLWALTSWSTNPGGATTIGAIITNGRLTKAELARVCRMGHDGMARAIDPVHTPWDGDTLFAASVGNIDTTAARVGALAGRAITLAIRRAVMMAGGTEGAKMG